MSTRNDSERLTERALREEVALPLTAMRISVESLAKRLPESSEEARVAHSLQASLMRVADRLDTILEYLATPSPRALACTVEEILRSTRSRLGKRGAQLEVASSCTPDTIFVDGPLLVRLLSRLLEGATKSSSETVLLSVREAADDVLFAIVHSESPATTGGESALDRVSRRLALREANLLGAELCVRNGMGDQVVTLLSVPRNEAGRGGLAA